jgi:hypothetical protein
MYVWGGACVRADGGDLVIRSEYTLFEVQVASDKPGSQEVDGERRWLVDVSTFLTNRSNQNVRVATGNCGPYTEFGPDYLKIRYDGQMDESPQGDVWIVSESEWKPVNLKPGETTRMRYRVALSKPARAGRIQVIYNVAEAVGQRYSVWSGTISSIAEPQPKPSE